LRNAILVDYSELLHPNIAIKAFYMITSLGHQAVMVFFVLSGYFVGGAVLRSGAKFTWKTYLTLRLVRIWVVLVPCLFITWVIGMIVEHYVPSVLAGANIESWHSGPKIGGYSADFSTFLANVFFMQTTISPVFGLNSPLWSLANEFWYYMLFPLLLAFVGLLKPSSYLYRISALGSAMLITWCLPKEMMYGFLIWMMGVGVYVSQFKIQSLSQNTIRILLLISIILFFLALGCSKSSNWSKTTPIEPDFIIGVAFAFLCLILSNLSFPEIRWPWFAKVSLCLSEISYSLYLSHFPIIVLISSTVYESHKFSPDIFFLAQFLGWSFILVSIGSSVWWLFESQTVFVRTKVISLVESMMKVSFV
jgi:peptidoglycan/LPS O-acetylase OafA/YrhL